MSSVQAVVESVPVLAYTAGTLIAVGVVLGVVLAIYAIYWMIFKMGK